MPSIKEQAREFLAQERIAVAGVSRNRNDAANLIYRKLKATGRTVFAVNPNAESFDGDPCYPDLGAIPGGADGVVIVTRPERAAEIVAACPAAGVRRVWMHESLFKRATSVAPEATELCRKNGIEVIPGACPMMFAEPVDFGHKCMRWMLKVVGRMPG